MVKNGKKGHVFLTKIEVTNVKRVKMSNFEKSVKNGETYENDENCTNVMGKKRKSFQISVSTLLVIRGNEGGVCPQ